MLTLFKKKWFWKLSWKMMIVFMCTGYYAHVLYEKANLQTSASEIIAHDYQVIVTPFLNLLGKAEGNSSTFYPDNKGYAIGYGFNPTQNSREYNQDILDFAKVDKKTAQTILDESGKYHNVSEAGKVVPEELKNVHLSQDEINRMAVYAQQSYEKSFITVLQQRMQNEGYSPQRISKALNEYQNLPDNQKAVLIHMTYKVGEPGLRKYHGFFHDLVIYLDNQNEVNRQKVANDFIYHYTSGKKVLLDTRVMKIHHDMFLQTPVYHKPVVNHDNQSATPLTEQEKYLKASREINEQWTFHALWTYLLAHYKKAQENKSTDMVQNNAQEDNQTTDNDSDNSDEDNAQVSYQVTRLIQMSRSENGQQTTVTIEMNNGDDNNDSEDDN